MMLISSMMRIYFERNYLTYVILMYPPPPFPDRQLISKISVIHNTNTHTAMSTLNSTILTACESHNFSILPTLPLLSLSHLKTSNLSCDKLMKLSKSNPFKSDIAHFNSLAINSQFSIIHTTRKMINCKRNNS